MRRVEWKLLADERLEPRDRERARELEHRVEAREIRDADLGFQKQFRLISPNTRYGKYDRREREMDTIRLPSASMLDFPACV
jgi:hypothetical protein